MPRAPKRKSTSVSIVIALVVVGLLCLSILSLRSGAPAIGNDSGFCCLQYGQKCQIKYTAETCLNAGGKLFSKVSDYCHQACVQTKP
jgi:hypothetical protein